MTKFSKKIALGVAAALVSSAALAAPANELFWVYYSDASHTTIVGTKERDCFGNITKEGQITSYYDTYQGARC